MKYVRKSEYKMEDKNENQRESVEPEWTKMLDPIQYYEYMSEQERNKLSENRYEANEWSYM